MEKVYFSCAYALLNSRLFHAVPTRFSYTYACAYLTSRNQALMFIHRLNFNVTATLQIFVCHKV